LLQELARLPMPGNVRELENLLYRAVALGDGERLQLDSPFQSSPSTREASTHAMLAADQPMESITSLPDDLQSYLDDLERGILTQALQATGFNRTTAAARLGLSLRQMRYRIARLQIEAPHTADSNDKAE